MINIGFIGVGGYGRVQLEGFLPFHTAGRVCIRALADRSPQALATASGIGGLGGADVFLDYRGMLDRCCLDAVVVSAPIPTHKEITLDALNRGLFVLLEKPPVPLLSELRELFAADLQRRVMVGFQHIYMPLVHRMKEAVWSGEIGRPLEISTFGLWPRTTEYYERSPWVGELFWEGRSTLDGPCTNAMAHFLNSMLFIAGKMPSGFARPERLEGEVYRARPIASYDLGALRGFLDNGMRFSAAFSHASAEKMPARIIVQGTEGRVELIDDARIFRDPKGRIIEGTDGRNEMRLAFLEFAENRPDKNLTGLEATEPYVLATNMMFLSSGGIHSIGADFITVHKPETPETVFSVAGIKEVFQSSCSRMISLEKASAAWAVPSRMLSRKDFNEDQMLHCLGVSRQAGFMPSKTNPTK